MNSILNCTKLTVHSRVSPEKYQRYCIRRAYDGLFSETDLLANLPNAPTSCSPSMRSNHNTYAPLTACSQQQQLSSPSFGAQLNQTLAGGQTNAMCRTFTIVLVFRATFVGFIAFSDHPYRPLTRSSCLSITIAILQQVAQFFLPSLRSASHALTLAFLRFLAPFFSSRFVPSSLSRFSHSLSCW